MNSITGFLQKFLNLEKDNSVKLSLVLETIRKETGLELPKELLEIKGNILKINCNPVFRNEIFMHCFQIESSLRSRNIFLKLI